MGRGLGQSPESDDPEYPDLGGFSKRQRRDFGQSHQRREAASGKIPRSAPTEPTARYDRLFDYIAQHSLDDPVICFVP